MKRYESYKPSGISWIGEIPSHWEVKRLGAFLARFNSDSGDTNIKIGLENITSWTGKFIKTDTIYDGKGSYFEKGDILYGKLRPYLAKTWVAEFNGQAVGDFYVLRCKNSSYNHFVKLLLLNKQLVYLLDSFTYGAKMPRVSWNDMSRVYIPYPPLDEQKKIVEYLSTKTSLIDAQQSAREKEIRLLEELKQAEIANVVTRGLNPDVPKKDSGIPWIGKIPSHWETPFLFQFCNEHFISNKNVHHQNLLSLSYGKIIRKDINKTDGLLPKSFDTYQIVEPGNMILRLTDLQNDQKSLRVGLAKEEGIITSAYVALEVKDKALPEYLYLILHTYDIKKVFYSMGGGLRQSLNFDGLRKLNIPIPPLEEQRAIVEYIEQKNKAIDDMIANLRAEIDFLTEYKQRLIADAVTGQIKID